jgi:hypothetical protein
MGVMFHAGLKPCSTIDHREVAGGPAAVRKKLERARTRGRASVP